MHYFTPLILTLLSATAVPAATMVQTEFIYDEAPFPSCHAATIAETPQGLVAAWFGGQEEGDPSVGIWFSRHTNGAWTRPSEVANGDQSTGDVSRYPSWNPVLHQIDSGPLQLYYKVGPSPSDWWGLLIESADGGQSWSEPRRLPDGILGPIKNKAITLSNGDILSGSSTEHDGWRVHFERSSDNGRTWTRTDAVNRGDEFGIIQPTLFVTQDGDVVAYSRSRRNGKVIAVRSTDGGKTWTSPTTVDLPNPNSGIDGVTLADGRHALVYNHTPRGRSPLNLAIAKDDEFTWQPAIVLESEPGEYSYPAIIQTRDGKLHIVYTWKRQRIKHTVVAP